MTENPFEPNIVFTISEIEEHNPFEPVLGTGGYNSGQWKKGLKTDLPVDSKDRNNAIWANAQRTYRNRNRDAYNANMLELWRKNKEEKNDSYTKWLTNQSNANERYRLKKKLEKLQTVKYEDLKTVPLKIKKAVDKNWKNTPKPERDAVTTKKKVKVGSYKLELYKKAWEAEQAKEIKYIEEKLGDNKTIEKGKYNQVERGGRKVNSKLANPSYADVDYTGLSVGIDDARRANNLKDLYAYHKSVLTTQQSVPDNRADTNKQYSGDFKKLRASHRDNLTAGDWTLDGKYKKSDDPNKSNIRKANYKNPRPDDERYEKKGSNKI